MPFLATRVPIFRILSGDGPQRTIRAVAAGLTVDQQFYDTAIADAFERALALNGQTRDERLGTAHEDAHSTGQDPSKVFT